MLRSVGPQEVAVGAVLQADVEVAVEALASLGSTG